MKRIAGIVAIVVVAVVVAYLWLRPKAQLYPEAYIGDRTATVWSSLAQVRQQVATLHFGQKVEVVAHRGDQAQIRLASGVLGWLDGRELMDAVLWQQSMKLLGDTRKMPLQARGVTKVPTNVRAQPGRNAARVFQFGREVPVEIFARAAVAWAPSPEETAARESSAEEQKARREDWLLVRGRASAMGNPVAPGEGGAGAANVQEETVDVAGWVLARFIALTLPDAIKDYASSSGMHVLAWFELNRVPEQPGSQTEKPQYLVAGTRGGEEQPCDFSMIRVYTWGAARQRYETAYVEGQLCGYLPIRVARASSGEPEFRFQALEESGKEELVYRMKQTIVRRVRESGEAPRRRRR